MHSLHLKSQISHCPKRSLHKFSGQLCRTSCTPPDIAHNVHPLLRHTSIGSILKLYIDLFVKCMHTKNQFLSQFFACCFYATLIFGGAGTFEWLEGWLFLSAITLMSFAIHYAHDLNTLNQQSSKRLKLNPSWIKSLSNSILIGLLLIWLCSNGIDTARYGLSEVPFWIQCLGSSGFVISLLILYYLVEVNYTTALICQQKYQRKWQVMIQYGPYKLIRHPVSLNTSFMIFCASCMMGSILGLCIAMIIFLWLAIDTFVEDKLLQINSKSYALYTRKIQYRWIPGIW